MSNNYVEQNCWTKIFNKMKNKFFLYIFFLAFAQWNAWASHILIPMDDTQTNHLKAYGISYWALARQIEIKWLLNYRGGSFMCAYEKKVESELVIRGVSYSVISDAQEAQIISEINSADNNMDVMKLEKAPKVAVYSPKSKQPWDDAVTLVLNYAEIPYEIIFDDEVMDGKLSKYDWLHLHHEDFTGQYGKFYAAFRNAPWYVQQVKEFEACAKKYGFPKVSQLKLAVVKKNKRILRRRRFYFCYVLGSRYLRYCACRRRGGYLRKYV